MLSARATPLQFPGADDVVDVALNTSRCALMATAPTVGAYLVFMRIHHPRDRAGLLGELYPVRDLQLGRWPLYIGSGHVGDRTRRHSRSLEDCGIDPELFAVATIPTASLAHARFVELTLIESLPTPIWNESWLSGFGSRTIGPARVDGGQTESAWDCVHGRRSWARTLRPRDRAELRARIHAYLAGPGAPLPAWEPLP